MVSKVATFGIKIIHEPFTVNDEQYSQTAIISVYIAGDKLAEHRYAVADANMVYEKFIQTGNLNLDHLYIHNFSITDLKSILQIYSTEYLEINQFSAFNTFFDCNIKTDFSYVKFNCDVNFSHSIFEHGLTDFYHTQFKTGNIDFSKVRFGQGFTNFQYCEFGSGEKNFNMSLFYGGLLSFVNAKFNNGNVIFSNAHFHETKVKFHFAEFGIGDIDFYKSKFGNQTVDFRKVDFGKGKVDFRRSTFGSGFLTFDESSLIDSRFTFKLSRFVTGNLSFKNLLFENSELSFESSDIGSGLVSFENSKIKQLYLNESRFHAYLDLKVADCQIIDISHSVFRDVVDLKPMENTVNIDILKLNGSRILGKVLIDWKKNNVRSWVENQPDAGYLQKSEQFNILKEIFNANGQYDDEDEAYVQFKQYELKAIKEKHKTENKFGVKFKILYAFRWLVFDKMGKYATSPSRVLFSLGIVYLLFSLGYIIMIYAGLGDVVSSVNSNDNLNIIQKSFYHSAITFLTIGYGDYYPTSYCRILSVAEGWFGVFMMAYFTVAFVRKILR